MILAGDVGGTKTNLALFDASLDEKVSRTYRSGDHAGLAEILRRFVSEAGRGFERACFGVPGPVVDGTCRTTNLPWVVDARELARDLGLRTVSLINDLEANAYGIGVLGAGDIEVLSEGAPGAAGNAALIAAGTGLGEAGLYWDGRRHRPFASEGGHADFAPRNELEIEFLRFLRARYGRVSWERVVSGPGLQNIYTFLRDTGRGEEPAWLSARLREEDPAAVISRVALEGSSELCAQALEQFVSLYGAEAGNLALKVMARGGVYLGGGIVPRILPRMGSPIFMQSFVDKGRMQALLESMPVRVILNDRCALLGAARHALLSET